MARIPMAAIAPSHGAILADVVIEGELKTLSPGGQNILVEKIVNEFAPRFTPRGKLIYVGDTDEKFAHFNESALAALGVRIDSHGKMSDVIIHRGRRAGSPCFLNMGKSRRGF